MKEIMIEIDFNSDEAIYMQLRNQIIMGIALSAVRDGDTLPSVRKLSEQIGVNMHTVNKAYAVLKQEGFIQLDRRKGAVIAVSEDKLQALEDMKQQLRMVLARGYCKNITREEVHKLVDEMAAAAMEELADVVKRSETTPPIQERSTDRKVPDLELSR